LCTHSIFTHVLVNWHQTMQKRSMLTQHTRLISLWVFSETPLCLCSHRKDRILLHWRANHWRSRNISGLRRGIFIWYFRISHPKLEFDDPSPSMNIEDSNHHDNNICECASRNRVRTYCRKIDMCNKKIRRKSIIC